MTVAASAPRAPRQARKKAKTNARYFIVHREYTTLMHKQFHPDKKSEAPHARRGAPHRHTLLEISQHAYNRPLEWILRIPAEEPTELTNSFPFLRQVAREADAI